MKRFEYDILFCKVKKQKDYKKRWRQQLANLEYATSDLESVEAIESLAKMVMENRGEIPEGARKMDLDQVYKKIKPNLGKTARMEFLQLDEMVRSAVTVKDMREE